MDAFPISRLARSGPVWSGSARRECGSAWKSLDSFGNRAHFVARLGQAGYGLAAIQRFFI